MHRVPDPAHAGRSGQPQPQRAGEPPARCVQHRERRDLADEPVQPGPVGHPAHRVRRRSAAGEPARHRLRVTLLLEEPGAVVRTQLAQREHPVGQPTGGQSRKRGRHRGARVGRQPGEPGQVAGPRFGGAVERALQPVAQRPLVAEARRQRRPRRGEVAHVAHQLHPAKAVRERPARQHPDRLGRVAVALRVRGDPVADVLLAGEPQRRRPDDPPGGGLDDRAADAGAVAAAFVAQFGDEPRRDLGQVGVRHGQELVHRAVLHDLVHPACVGRAPRPQDQPGAGEHEIVQFFALEGSHGRTACQTTYHGRRGSSQASACR
jgi:hypothetical protein